MSDFFKSQILTFDRLAASKASFENLDLGPIEFCLLMTVAALLSCIIFAQSTYLVGVCKKTSMTVFYKNLLIEEVSIMFLFCTILQMYEFCPIDSITYVNDNERWWIIWD